MSEVKPLILLNGLNPSMFPGGGTITLKPLTPDEAIEMILDSEVESYIEDELIARLLTMLVAKKIPVNRLMYVADKGDRGIVVSVNKLTINVAAKALLDEGRRFLTKDERNVLLGNGLVSFAYFEIEKVEGAFWYG